METQATPKLKLWKWILLFVGGFILSIIGYGLLTGFNELANYLGHPILTIAACAVLLWLYKLLVKAFEKRKTTDLNLRKLLPHCGLGIVIGFILMTVAVSTIAALGCADIMWQGSSLWEQYEVVMLFLMVGVGEELIFRGVVFRLLDQRWGLWTALIVSSLLFGLIHISNANATWWAALAIAIEAGLMLGIAYKWSGSLWMPIGIHWAWNYTQGNFFGLAVSGNDAGRHILTTTVNGPDLITGGAFGPEASIISTVLGLFVAVILLCNMGKLTSKKSD